MMILLALLFQTSDVEQNLRHLDHDDPALREAATMALIEAGPGVVGRVFEFHRNTSSEEARARAEEVLKAHPFRAIELVDRKGPLYSILTRPFLKPLEAHGGKCRGSGVELVERDAAEFRLTLQTGSGHGGGVGLLRMVPGGDGGLLVRRIMFEDRTTYRPKVEKETVIVESGTIPKLETGFLLVLLEEAVALRSKCSLGMGPFGYGTSSDFTLHIGIRYANQSLWSGGYTGYRSSMGDRHSKHPSVIASLLRPFLKRIEWKTDTATRGDVSAWLGWMSDRFDSESGWVRERFLKILRTVGDPTCLPFLESKRNGDAADKGRFQKLVRGAIDAIRKRNP